MSTLSKYIGDTDIVARFRVRQLRVAVLVVMGGSRRGAQGAQGARAPSKPMADRSGRIGSVLLALPVRFQNALKHA